MPGGYGPNRSYSDGKGGTYTVNVETNPELSKTPELDKKIAAANAQRYGLTSGPKSNQPTQFDLARKRAAQTNAAQQQQIADAMKRRQAQLGGGPRGAFLKHYSEIISGRQSSTGLAPSPSNQIDPTEARIMINVGPISGQLNSQNDAVPLERTVAVFFALSP